MTAGTIYAREEGCPVPVEEAEILAALRRLSLVGSDETPPLVRLLGGVSSDIFRVDRSAGPICVKRALPKLRVKDDWRAPVDRSRYEAAWMRVAAGITPSAVPALLGEDRQAGLFAMAYLDPEDHPVWKDQLRAGIAEPDMARAVGTTLVRIHAATAGREDIARCFDADRNFWSLRLDPYLVAAAGRHDDVAAQLKALASATAGTKRTLVHGDVSPKNILCGPDGPVFLDAECAWYGDPAFDLAFCLNHLMLKCVWRPNAGRAFLDCYAALCDAYREGVNWESAVAVEARAAHLLPGLFLARIDGKSPVEYISKERDKDLVRGVAKRLLRDPVETLSSVGNTWARELS